ncbi:MAG: triphosphoribosyl-dephospho-CoA synthase [Candidatus Hermodarchaeota archaeon]
MSESFFGQGQPVGHSPSNKDTFCQISAQMATLACLFDVTTPKAGNVHRFSDFKDMGQEHFLASAIASFPTFFEGSKRGKAIREGRLSYSQTGLGELIKNGILASREWGFSQNANLGILLLLIPLCTISSCVEGRKGENWIKSARSMLSKILDHSTSMDSKNILTAIHLAQPAGLGKSEKFDVLDPHVFSELENNQVNLRQLFWECRTRDLICQEYTTNFEGIFKKGLLRFYEARKNPLPLRETILDVYLNLLASQPDTHLIRKFGATIAREVQQKGQDVLKAGSAYSKEGILAAYKLDKYLKERGYNPGTTADFTVASLFTYWLDLWHKNRKLDLSNLITPGNLMYPWCTMLDTNLTK